MLFYPHPIMTMGPGTWSGFETLVLGLWVEGSTIDLPMVSHVINVWTCVTSFGTISYQILTLKLFKILIYLCKIFIETFKIFNKIY
jgi:hypothetical protein